MPTNTSNEYYDFIKDKISNLKKQYQFLRDKSDDYVFSALCIKNSIYKNPEHLLSESELSSFIVDGSHDGGVDFMLPDPNNEGTDDYIIGQAKYYTTITTDIAKNAIHKMIDFYLNMRSNYYGNTREDVIHRFLSLEGNVGDESKVKFMLFTSAKKNHIQDRVLQKILTDRLGNTGYELFVYFAEDVAEEIKEAESRRPDVEDGKLELDEANNVLRFSGDAAAVVNISAKSLKTLYAQHNKNLLAKNLRYFIKGKSDVNTDIKNTIANSPDSFWYKNNGITIVCESFRVDGRELKLKRFSIVNGGQTTYLIFKNGPDNNTDDFFITCKVISIQGTSEDERSQFVLDIAKATNSQKPIKPSDLKANAPEQIRFANNMKEVGIFYNTKRGDAIPSQYKDGYKNSEISKVGKLSLAGIFQIPGTSRNKPSSFYDEKYYGPTFRKNQKLVSGYIRDLLYVDYYFDKYFLAKFDRTHRDDPILPFAHNSRTICISFVALGARIILNDIPNFGVIIQHVAEEGFYENYLYPKLKDYDHLPYIIKPEVFNGDKDILDDYLFKLFSTIIKEGFKSYESAHEYDQTLNATNYLKRDASYFKILKKSWTDLKESFDNNRGLFV